MSGSKLRKEEEVVITYIYGFCMQVIPAPKAGQK